MSRFPILILLFFTLSLSSPADENSRTFFRGFLSSSLHVPDYSEPILNYVNSSNFPIDSLFRSCDTLRKNINSNAITGSFEAFSQISLVFSRVLDALFPIISFSLRFDGIRRFIPENYSNVFAILNETFVFYVENAKYLVFTVNKANYSQLLTQILHEESIGDFFSAGKIFEEFSANLHEEAINSRRISEENSSDQFLMGILKGLGCDSSPSQDFALLVNSSSFDEHRILEEFNLLSQNTMNFSDKIEKENFLVIIEKIAFFLKNVRNLAAKDAKKPIYDEISSIYRLFEGKYELQRRILRVRDEGADLRLLFKEMYLEGEVEGKYEEAGKTFAKVCELLDYKDQSYEGFFAFFLHILRFFV